MAIKNHGQQQMSDPPPVAVTPFSSLDRQLFARRASTVIPPTNGKDIAFCCIDESGRFFFCKDDRAGRDVRATELIVTRLANRLGIRTADWAVIEHDGQTYFGSQQEVSSALPFQVQDYLATPQKNELGQPYAFPGEWLAQLLAFDLFVGNPDRGPHNFLLVKDGSMSQICAIDFADSRLTDLATDRFPVAQSTTVHIGRRYRSIHGSHHAAAVQMIDQIEALPATVFSRIVSEVPADWQNDIATGGLIEVWGSPGFKRRLASLRSVLTDGTLV